MYNALKDFFSGICDFPRAIFWMFWDIPHLVKTIVGLYLFVAIGFCVILYKILW